ncbi:MAG: hydrolase [Proteobacteria bacterium]|nr:hydrolase [Pseudomonadota bacterium]
MNLQESCRWIESRQDDLVDRLCQLSAINSGTANLPGLGVVAEEFQALYSPLAENVELLDSAVAERVDLNGELVQERFGKMLTCNKRPDAPIQVLLVGHMDTVFPVEHAFQQPRMLDANMLTGPGVADMKGGLLVMHTALTAFEQCQDDDRLGWRVLLNADEETGSHGSASELQLAATQAHAGLIFEPALPDGSFSRARKGSGNFTLVAKGRAAHAGREFETGVNAILAMTEAAQRLGALTDLARGITVNIARVSGGTAFNVVPDQAVCQFNVRCISREQQQQLAEQLAALVAELNQAPGIQMLLSGGFSRPPKRISPANQLLMDWTSSCGASLGLTVRFNDTGGCCDGNNLAAAGLPNIDTLGVVGGEIHTDQEFMRSDSLTERARLSLLLLDRLSREGESLIELNAAARDAAGSSHDHT